MPPTNMTVNIRVTDMEPVKRLIDTIADVAKGAVRDGYTSPELTALHDAISDIRNAPEPVPPSLRLMLDGQGHPVWVSAAPGLKITAT